MRSLRPFFSFYGSKWRTALRYPVPLHRTIIEPFAGSAGYATRHHHHDVILVEKDPVIAALWRFLISASVSEIASLPLLLEGQTVDDLDIPEEARTLIGFWLNHGSTTPKKSPSAWMRAGQHNGSFWGDEIRCRVAGQVCYIRHWRVIEGDYREAPDATATWFIDPPYQKAGALYRCRLSDYSPVADWSRERSGQIIVCEHEGADWLPFRPHIVAKSMEGARGKGQSREAIWP